MPIIELKLCHGVGGADLKFLHIEIAYLLHDYVALSITFRLNLDLLSPILLLNIFIPHNIVQVFLNLDIRGIFKDRSDSACIMIDD